MSLSQDEDAPTIEVAYCGTKSLQKIIPPSVLSLKAPAGAYCICGRNAYQSLPFNWRGICSLGYMIPAMRISSTLPVLTHVRKTRYANLFHTHDRSCRTCDFFRALLPQYGVMSALDQITDLSVLVEELANTTSEGFIAINAELASVRMMTLQNRAALDYLLASQGGTCALIGSECCTYIPDYNNITIPHIIDHLHDISKPLHAPKVYSLYDWLTEKLGYVSTEIMHYVLYIFLGIILFLLLIHCLKTVISSRCNKSPVTQMLNGYDTPNVVEPLNPLTPYMGSVNFLNFP